MDKKTRRLTLSALFTAFCVISLYIASVWPTGQLGLTAFASLFVAAAIIESGLSFGLYVFIAGSALGMLLLPNKIAPLLYILFFGYYPIIKSLIERINGILLQWTLKLLVFNAALTVIWVFLKELFFGFIDNTLSVALLYLGGNAVFALFDYGFSKVVLFYAEIVHKRG